MHDVRSSRNIALQSHHFLVRSDVEIEIPKLQKENRQPHRSVAALQDSDVQQKFVQTFVSACAKAIGRDSIAQITPDEAAQVMKRSFQEAEAAALPERKVKALRPWISDETLRLIEERDDARRNAD